MQSTVFRGHVAACCYSSVVGMSVWVCLCVGHDREPCKNGWTDRDAIWAGADSRGFKKRCITLGVHFGTFWRMRWIDLCGSGDAYCRYHYYSNFLLVLTPWQSWAILVNFDKENRTESWFSWMRFVLNADKQHCSDENFEFRSNFRSNFAEIFGNRKLDSLGYRVVLFVWSYVLPF